MIRADAEYGKAAARADGISVATRDECGRIIVLTAGVGAPSACSSDTSASPTFSSVIAVATSTPGLARNVSAAALIAFWSRGVKARSACRSEEHTSELQSLMRISYAVFCLKITKYMTNRLNTRSSQYTINPQIA